MTEGDIYKLNDAELLNHAVMLNRELNRRGLLECFETSQERHKQREVEAILEKGTMEIDTAFNRAIA